MDRQLKSKIDEISGAFEKWAKEVADRIVEAAQQGAETAARRTDPDHDAAPEREANSNGGSRSEEDPWLDWARMRNETWNQWARGKFDKPVDTEAMRNAYREVLARWGDTPFARMCDEAFRQIEKIIRNASESRETSEATAAVDMIGEFVEAEVEPAAKADRRGDVELSKFAQKLIARIKKLDQKGKPKKMVKTLLAELEADLKKRNKKSGKKK